MVRWVCSDDLVHNHHQVYEMVKGELGFQRNGKNIETAIRAAIQRVNPDLSIAAAAKARLRQ